MDLRPLGFGEIFDRAVTLYIRNFVPFLTIVVVLVIPLAVLQYLADLSTQPQIDLWWRIITHPGVAQPTSASSALAFSNPMFDLAFVLLLLLTYAVWPFALNAVAVGVARLYRNQPVDFRACYEVALRRWPQVFGIIGIDLGVILGWYAVAVMAIVVFAIATTFMVALAPAAAFFFGLVLGLIGFLILLPSLAPLFVALAFAMYSVVLEERGVVQSVMLAFARVFNRVEFWRAVLFAIAVGAVMIGGSAMFGFVGLLAAFAHLPLLQAVIESLARAIITPFGVVLMAIYYFDVRIRREAFDLESSLERLAAPQPA